MWGQKNWDCFIKKFNKNEKIDIIIGEWSGYTSNQKKVCHIDFADKYQDNEKKSIAYGKIEFSDRTYLEVYRKSYSFQDILREKIMPKICYRDLIQKMISSGKNFYKVE